MSASAGRVLILLKGEYNNSVQYQMLDAVKYQGSLYIARKTTLGNVPQEGEYWMLSTVGGQWGEIGGTLADQLDLKTALDGKQATLTFDNTPTASSTNPVTSDGIKTAIDTKITNPGGGSVGDVLKKTANGEEWATETASAWGSITGTLSDQTDLQNAFDGKAGIGSIATIEANFATTAHSVGEYVYWNGHLYEVIAAIAANEALIDGTNVTAVSVGEELSSLKNGLSNLMFVTTTYKDFTLPANARTVLYPTLPTVPTGYRAVLLAAQMAVNSKDVLFQGTANNNAMFYSIFSTALSGNDFPLYCTWAITKA